MPGYRPGRRAGRRRFYNANVRGLNPRFEQVPSNAVAGMFDFEPAGYFKSDEASVRAAPAVD